MLQVSLLLLSFAGYFLLLYILFNGKRAALYPAFLASGIITISFLAGLAGCLQYAFIGMYLAGFALLPAGVIALRRKRDLPRPELRVLLPFVLLAIGAYVIYGVFEGRFIYNYDDLAHWARAVRSIADNLRLPVEADEFSHGSYPPGSALYIAYVSTVMGASDQVWFFAHGLLLLSFWIALLGAGRNCLMQLLLACFIPWFMNYVIPLESLLVDTMLGASATACLALCLQEEEPSAGGTVQLAVLLCPLALIKSSGLFIVLIIAGYQIVRYRRKHHAFAWHLLALAVPCLLTLAWNLYFSQHFVNIQQHEISVDYYSWILGEKTMQDILLTFRMVISLMLDPRDNYALAIIPGYLLIMFILARQGKLRQMRHIFILAGVLTAVYETGMMLMYLVSMPEVEIIANNGSDFIRYNSTLAITLQALLLYLCAGLEWPGLRKVPLRSLGIAGAVLVCCAGVACMQRGQHRPFQPRQARINNYPAAYQAFLIQDELRSLPWDASYIVCIESPERAKGFNRRLVRYYLGNADVIRFTNREEALVQRAREPWKYYIELASGRIELPMETVNTELFTRTAKTICTNQLNTAGYKENTRFSTTNLTDTVTYYWDVTGYIPVKAGDVIRLKNVTWQPTEENEARGSICWYDEQKEYLSSIRTKNVSRLINWNPRYDAQGNVIQITVPYSMGPKPIYLRICCQDIHRDSIITVNETIP